MSLAPTRSIQSTLTAIDAFFLPDSLRNGSVEELLRARTALFGSAFCALAGALFIPTQILTRPFAEATTAAGITSFILIVPFLLRQKRAIRTLGHIVTGVMLLYASSMMLLSGGTAAGIFAVFPVVPMCAVMMHGPRAGAFWTLMTGLSLGLGMIQVANRLEVPLVTFDLAQPLLRYPTTFLSVVVSFAIATFFARLHSRGSDETMQANDRVAMHEQRFRALIEGSLQGVWVVDANGRFLYSTPAAAAVVGRDPESLIGQSAFQFVHPEDRRTLVEAGKLLLGSPGSTGLVRGRIRGAQGDWRILDSTMSNQFETPSIGGMVLSHHDVTERVRAEENYRSLFDNSSQGIAVTSGAGILYVNQALCELTGIEREAFLSPDQTPFHDHIHEDDHDAAVRAFYQGGSPTPFTIRFVRPDGRLLWLQVRWSDVVYDGASARQIIYLDVTAEKELERARERTREVLEERIEERTRELEASQASLRESERLATIGTLAAGVAHQINNPIGAILMITDYGILVEEERDPNSENTQLLRDIQEEAVRCSKIVRSILQFSRAERTEKWPEDPNAVVRTAYSVTRPYAVERKAEITIELSEEVHHTRVLMNPIEIEQVIINLLRNSVESKREGANISLTSKRRGDFVEISISDDGRGIDEGEKGRIFEPFFTTRLQEGGTGLGLSVAHGILIDHGGDVVIEDSPTGGTRFIVRLPIHEE